MSSWAAFRGLLNICLRGTISVVILGPKIEHDSGLVIFLNIFHWFHTLLVLHAYWGMFRCISRCISTCSRACLAIRPLVYATDFHLSFMCNFPVNITVMPVIVCFCSCWSEQRNPICKWSNRNMCSLMSEKFMTLELPWIVRDNLTVGQGQTWLSGRSSTGIDVNNSMSATVTVVPSTLVMRNLLRLGCLGGGGGLFEPKFHCRGCIFCKNAQAKGVFLFWNPSQESIFNRNP